jgi:hypothetical protein
MTRELDEEIKALEARLASLDSQLHEHREKFTNAAVEWLRLWYWETTEQIVTGDGKENTRSLGSERIAELKARVEALRDEAAQTINETLGADDIWERWRANRAVVSHCSVSRDVQGEMAFATGKLGPVLEEFGYLPKSEWREFDRVTGVRMSYGRPRYPSGIVLSEALLEQLKLYEQAGKRWIECHDAIRKAKDRQAESEAKDLWDRA